MIIGGVSSIFIKYLYIVLFIVKYYFMIQINELLLLPRIMNNICKY